MEKCTSETIAEALEADLASGRWKTGERLPSVDELRARFGAGTRWGLTPLYFHVVRDNRPLREEEQLRVQRDVGGLAEARGRRPLDPVAHYEPQGEARRRPDAVRRGGRVDVPRLPEGNKRQRHQQLRLLHRLSAR